MLRFLKTVFSLALLALGVHSAWAFSLLGPGTIAWQVPEIGYNLPGDIGGPHNLGEEYRWNTPTNYYAFDQNWLDYFGSNGVWAVEQAFAVFNGVKPFSQYSTELNEVPLQTRRINYRAQQLHLMDLKSATMGLVLEELGLTDSERYVWTLRTRVCSTCPACTYGIIKWSFDPVNWQPSSYINGVLYSYIIEEFCNGTPVAFTFPFPVDPLAVEHLPVSKFQTLNYGIYTTGLTRDDVGGLRYSYATNNVNWEATATGTELFSTNYAGGQQLLITSNLTLLATQALTNNAAGLQALYPDLNITGTTNIFTNIWVTNLIAYFTNSPYDPIGTPPRLAFTTSRTLTVQTWYHHTFGNLVTFRLVNGVWTPVPVTDLSFFTGPAIYTVETTTVTNSPYDPIGTPPHTNTTRFSYATNDVVGDFFILASNICAIAVSGLQATLVNSYTNVAVSVTNTTGGTTTNATTGTNAQFFTQNVITFSTNHVFTYYPVNCIGTNVALMQGIDKMTFLRANYDSLSGRFFQPITNVFRAVEVTNSKPVVRYIRRVVTQPDFLFTAQDTTSFATLGNRTDTAVNFNEANANVGLAGPGNIEPNMTITLNKVGPLLVNFFSPFFIQNGLSERAATTNFIWGTFDGSTNPPVVYPSGASIANLEAQILFQIVTGSLPDGRVGAAYPTTQLQAAGGVAPYSSWTWSGGWPSLPPGLNLSPAGVISGTPTAAGTYGFEVSVTGADSRTITRSLSIKINP